MRGTSSEDEGEGASYTHSCTLMMSCLLAYLLLLSVMHSCVSLCYVRYVLTFCPVVLYCRGLGALKSPVSKGSVSQPSVRISKHRLSTHKVKPRPLTLASRPGLLDTPTPRRPHPFKPILYGSAVPLVSSKFPQRRLSHAHLLPPSPAPRRYSSRCAEFRHSKRPRRPRSHADPPDMAQHPE